MHRRNGMKSFLENSTEGNTYAERRQFRARRWHNVRPDLNDLSDRGTLPGIVKGVCIAKKGTVRAGRNGPVCGAWANYQLASFV